MPDSPGTNVSAIAIGMVGTGIVLAWSGLKGASVATTIQELVQGKRPSGTNVNAIDTEALAGSLVDQGLGIATDSIMAQRILQIAASKKGQCYSFGAGHGNPCGSRCSDCSSYVSCVLTKATGKPVDMATGGLATYGKGVPYSQRAPGDIIVWNGGTGGGHTGIIATVEGKGGKMWHNPCTGCGGVTLGRYPSGSRSAATAVVRRVDSMAAKPQAKPKPSQPDYGVI